MEKTEKGNVKRDEGVAFNKGRKGKGSKEEKGKGLEKDIDRGQHNACLGVVACKL